MNHVFPAAIKAHFIHETSGLLSKRVIYFPPRVGDELRFDGEKYFRVTLLVWVFDEPEVPYTRLNVGVVEAETDEQPTDSVPMPQDASQAVGMAKLGMKWLEQNAPDLLTSDARDAARWRAFRDRDGLPNDLFAGDFNEMFREDADAVIDAAMAAKGAT